MEQMIQAFLSGFGLSAALIMAIGAQNLFVLRQGLRRQHIGWIIALCAGADAVLMTAGVCGVGVFLAHVPMLRAVLTDGGALFLLIYGVMALRRAARASEVTMEDAPALSRPQALLMTAGMTFLNPHVYLDTMLLVGATGTAQPEGVRWVFLIGAVLASALWFTTLGLGARWLRPFFSRPLLWRWLDGGIGLIMIGLALSLVMGE